MLPQKPLPPSYDPLTGGYLQLVLSTGHPGELKLTRLHGLADSLGEPAWQCGFWVLWASRQAGVIASTEAKSGAGAQSPNPGPLCRSRRVMAPTKEGGRGVRGRFGNFRVHRTWDLVMGQVAR